MIRHCVFLRYRADVPGHEKDEILNEIRALQGRLEGLLAVHGGVNVSPEGLDKGHSEGFIVDFADAAARDRYLADAAHQATGRRIVAATAGGLDGVFVYDLETPE
ncbi:MAG: Dabb family protein [Azospirillaceae bacterium]